MDPAKVLTYYGDIDFSAQEELARRYVANPEDVSTSTSLLSVVLSLLDRERERVQEAIVLGQKRAEAMRDHERCEAIIAFDQVLSGHVVQTSALTATEARAMRADFVRRIEERP